MEEHIIFSCQNISLEGLLNQRSGTIGAVIAHPHPLYGGDMTNPVVESLADCLYRKGYTTLRFNFRGVGNSGGNHGEGITEGEDVLAAIRCLGDHGATSVLLVGYSFGAWVLAHLHPLPEMVTGMILVAPPLALMPFRGEVHLPKLQLVITGEEDEIAPPRLIKEAINGWNASASLAVIDNTDHFFFGSFALLTETVHDYLRSLQP